VIDDPNLFTTVMMQRLDSLLESLPDSLGKIEISYRESLFRYNYASNRREISDIKKNQSLCILVAFKDENTHYNFWISTDIQIYFAEHNLVVRHKYCTDYMHE
jgi:hypothetical protein